MYTILSEYIWLRGLLGVYAELLAVTRPGVLWFWGCGRLLGICAGPEERGCQTKDGPNLMN